MYPIIIGLLLLIGSLLIGNAALDKEIKNNLSTKPPPTITVPPSPIPTPTPQYIPQQQVQQRTLPPDLVPQYNPPNLQQMYNQARQEELNRQMLQYYQNQNAPKYNPIRIKPLPQAPRISYP